ncbi:MAG: nucleotidyltransferase [Bacteroidia bacterium]|nr:MAG: nucleotidyltransferase [Bacteroidia bacterium]
MKIIIPMAGMGKRLRPHTLVTPKPLFPIAGKPIVQRLIEDIAKVYEGKINEIAFIIGDFEESIKELLIEVARNLDTVPKIYYQHEPLGTAHAIWCAKDSINEEIIIAFADTLFRSDYKFNAVYDANIWVKSVPNPSAYGVVKLNDNQEIESFIEKPKEPISDLAIIGIYHFKNWQSILENINYLVQNDVRTLGEIQLTDALQRMKDQGCKFGIYEVQDWMDCGNKETVLSTNNKVLEYHAHENMIHPEIQLRNAHIIPPCFIDKNVVIENSIIGPYVSIGKGARIENSIIKSSIIQQNAKISNANLENSILGKESCYLQQAKSLNLGDYSHV